MSTDLIKSIRRHRMIDKSPTAVSQICGSDVAVVIDNIRVISEATVCEQTSLVYRVILRTSVRNRLSGIIRQWMTCLLAC